MSEVTETMIYELAFMVRFYFESKLSEGKIVCGLSERESLLLELLGTKGAMSISEVCNLYPKVSASTISTTITKLWKDKRLVDKKILPENQRITTVILTEKGRGVLRRIQKKQSHVFKTVTASLGLSQEQSEFFDEVLGNAIGFFDSLLGLQINESRRFGV